MSVALLCGGAEAFDEEGETLGKQDVIRWREDARCGW
jgi:hypothetical protein